jgi:putative ABC transport system permease protein
MKRSLRSWLWRVPLDEEVDEEIAFHLEMRTRELVERGVDPALARAQALDRLGDPGTLRRTCLELGKRRDRRMTLLQWIDELRHDITFSLRQLRHAPAFALVAILTLALGIGANAAIFALADATLLRPLPYGHPDRLVMLWERTSASPHGRVSPLNMLDWQEQSRTFTSMAGFLPGVGGMVMSNPDGTTQTVPRQWVTAAFFDVLDVKPIVGRTFLPSDDANRTATIVLSEGFWRSRFAADPHVVGRSIRLDGEPYTIVGVVPKTFQLETPTSIWALIGIPRRASLRAEYVLNVIGRLKPNVSIDAARADLAGVASGLAHQFPTTNAGRSVTAEPLRDAIVGGNLRLTAILFLGVVGFVLLICCANVANLLLARATVRRRELAIRSALGAGRRRVVRQLVTEGLVLSTIGAGIGLGMGAALLRLAPSVIPPDLLPAAVAIELDARVVVFCVAVAVLVGVLFGLAPAWQATRRPLAEMMAAAGRTSTGRGGRMRGVIVAGEVATAALLLVGAGLLLRTLVALNAVDRGYGASRALTMMVDPLGSQYPTKARLLQFFDDVERQVRGIPGVADMAWATTLPLGPSSAGSSVFEIVGDPPFDRDQRPTADYQIVSPTYFRTIDLPIEAGRAFDPHDTVDTVPVCIVNEAFVRKYLHGRSPLGIQVALRPADDPDVAPVARQIVGVARQVNDRLDATEDLIQVYVPMTQAPTDDIYLIVRPASGPPEALTRSVRAAIGRVDTQQLVSVRSVLTLDEVAAESSGGHRFRAVLVMTFAGLALLLAMIGVFGLLAYSVQQRVRDIGVRRALGATTADVIRLVAGGAARVITVGVAVGLLLAVGLVRLLTSVLFGVRPLDPLTFASVGLVLVVAAIAATAAPAWRAARIDPAAALRRE